MKRILCFILAMLFMLALPALAWADVAMERESDGTGATVTNDFDCVYYNNGNIVYNNGGIVFNNEGTVYNNGGTVYLNGGICYNNAGTVFSNGGELFNNGGSVIEAVIAKEADRQECIAEPEGEKLLSEGEMVLSESEKTISEDLYEITLPADYSRFADIEGFTEIGGKYYVSEGESVSITVKPGYTLLNSFVTTGKCTIRDADTVVFSDAQCDGSLTLKFQTDTPVLTPKFGAYGEKQELSFICGEGAVVYYLIDSFDDIKEKGKVYTEPISIEKSCRLQYYAQAIGSQASPVYSGYYVFPEISVPEFEAEYEGYEEIKPKAVSVKNTGMDRIKVTQAALSGEDKDAFILSSTEDVYVSAGIREEHSWFISPVTGLKAGIYTCTLELTYASGSKGLAEVSFEVK